MTTLARPSDDLLDAQEAQEIATEAYVYTYPLVMMDFTRRQMTNAEPGVRPGFGPMNSFNHMPAFPPPEFKTVPWANLDTLYSVAWLDLTREPMIVSTAATAGRYYLLPMQDMWTDVFAVPGTRTSGSSAGQFAVVPQGWHGELPAGVERVEASTPYVWILGRIQTNGVADYPAVHQVQDGLRVTPLSRYGQPPAQFAPDGIDPSVDMATTPVEQVARMSAADYFSDAAELLKLHPPHVTDWSTLRRIKRIGLVPGESFDVGRLDQTVKQALDRGMTAAQQTMKAKLSSLARTVNGWQMNVDTIGVYGNLYLKRAALALIGLGSNPPEDAIYPLTFVDSDGNPLTGESDYVLHFAPEELPPAKAFWSTTIYDQQGFQIPNPLNRATLGDRDPLQYNSDGSLDLFLQGSAPSVEHEANWLPTAPGPFAAFLRLYGPMPQALDGRWEPPPVRRQS